MNASELYQNLEPNGWANIDEPWKVLVVDDDPEVIAVTRLVTQDMSFKKRPIEIIEANSSKTARDLLEKHPDIAVVILDVVMESDHAGLDLVKEIRGALNNPMVRILLRTGQPGQAPEREVILDYDINDYRLKSDLTAQSLFSSLISALRSYEMVRELEFHQKLAFQTLTHQLVFEDQMMAMIEQPALYTDVMAFVTGANQAMASLLGTATGQMLGHDVSAILPAPLAETVRERKITKSEIGKVVEQKAAWEGPNGRPINVRCKTQVYRMGDDSPGGVILVLGLAP